MKLPSRFSSIISLTGHLLLALLVVAAAFLLLKHRYPDFRAAYDYVVNQIRTDISGEALTAAADTKNLAFLNTVELKHMLMSTDQAVRAAAVLALGEKGDLSVFPQLTGLLNDRTTVPHPSGTGETTLSQISREALHRMLRKAATREPANLAVLLPYLSTASTGGPAQRQAMVDILGAAGEPLALPLLRTMAETDTESSVRAKAKNAMDDISGAGASASYSEYRVRMREIVLGTGIVLMVLGVFVLAELARVRVSRLLGLRLMGLAILAGLTAILAIELTRGRGDAAVIGEAVSRGELMPLRTSNYHDFSEYAGDSHVARRLVTTGNTSMIHAIRRLPEVEPDDLEVLKEMLHKRTDWIAARLLVVESASESLPGVFDSADPGTKKYLADLLGRLKVRTDPVAQVLTKLSEDEDQDVQRAAEESLKRLRTYPQWIEPATP